MHFGIAGRSRCFLTRATLLLIFPLYAVAGDGPEPEHDSRSSPRSRSSFRSASQKTPAEIDAEQAWLEILKLERDTAVAEHLFLYRQFLPDFPGLQEQELAQSLRTHKYTRPFYEALSRRNAPFLETSRKIAAGDPAALKHWSDEFAIASMTEAKLEHLRQWLTKQSDFFKGTSSKSDYYRNLLAHLEKIAPRPKPSAANSKDETLPAPEGKASSAKATSKESETSRPARIELNVSYPEGTVRRGQPYQLGPDPENIWIYQGNGNWKPGEFTRPKLCPAQVTRLPCQ